MRLRESSSFIFKQRKQAVQEMEVFLKVVTSIPGIDNHDANAVALHHLKMA